VELANHLLRAKHSQLPIAEVDADQPIVTTGKVTCVGKSWPDRWLKKHDKCVRKYYGHSLDKIRANAVNPDNINHWFGLLKEVLDREEFVPELIYGMDETCGWGDTKERQKVLGKPGKKTQVQQRSINRESTTLIVSVSASGVALAPYCIFQGGKVNPSWLKKNPLNAK